MNKLLHLFYCLTGFSIVAMHGNDYIYGSTACHCPAVMTHTVQYAIIKNMFTEAHPMPGEFFPPAVEQSDEFHDAMVRLGVNYSPGSDVLDETALYAREHWIHYGLSGNESAATPYRLVPEYPLTQKLGLVDATAPTRDHYGAILVDGGSMPVFLYRLQHVRQLMAQGLTTDDLTVFGGQRPRLAYDDKDGRLENTAAQIYQNLNAWGRTWIEDQMSRATHSGEQWSGPFATEHEIAILALQTLFGAELRHTETILRKHTESVDPSIPPADVYAEMFQAGQLQIRVLNAPAIVRELFGKTLPTSDARPTGASCFAQWQTHARPALGASVLLSTNNPSTYRTWLDLCYAAYMSGRSDLYIEGAGAQIEQDRTFAHIMRSLGRLVIGLHAIRPLRNKYAAA